MLIPFKRREAQEAAVEILHTYGGEIWLDAPRFSPKWLTDYRPVWLLEKIVRRNPVARFLEDLGLLPKCYRKVAHFDADGIILTAYHYEPLMRRVARDISAAMGVEIKVVGRHAPVLARAA